MPRDGSNVYHRPSGTDAVPNTTVASAPYNSYTTDVEQDLNLPRPIVAGGTGATSADGALLALSAEKFKQVVTNWDSAILLPGSLYAATSATGAAPVAGHAFAGVTFYANATDFVQVVTDLTDAGHTNYTRVMAAGVWGAWSAVNTSLYVLKAGDTMSGDLVLSEATPSITMTKTASGNASGILSKLAAALRWIVLLGDTTAETGSNVGSDFVLQAYTDAGSPVTPPALTVKRSLNRLLLAGDPVAALDAVTKQYVDSGIGALVTTYVRYDTTQALTSAQRLQARNNIAAVLKGHLWGLILSTAGGSSTFSVAAGDAANSTAADLMTLAASLAKTTSAWAVGSAGGLDTGAIAINTWYHVYLIKRPDTGVVDVCISASAAAPTFGGAIPAAYTLYRRIGAVRTNASSQWIAFQQSGDYFYWTTGILDLNSSLTTSRSIFPLTVPPNTRALIRTYFFHASLAGVFMVLQPVAETDAAPTGVAAPLLTSFSEVINQGIGGQFEIPVDASSQIAGRASQTSTPLRVLTYGWIDRRGRDS